MTKQWVRFSEQKPKAKQACLIAWLEDSTYHVSESVIHWDDSWLLRYAWKYPGEITHWMPLPSPPGAAVEPEKP